MADDRRRTLVLALLVLTVAQLLHGLDLLRTDPQETLVTVLTAPQGLAGLGGSLLAALAVARRWAPWDLRLARLAGALIGVGFVVVHGLPWASPNTAPYWGEGSADAIEWLGVGVILVLCAWVLTLTRSSQESAVAVGT